MKKTERCLICGCRLSRKVGTYALPTTEGRSHASRHHYVPERFFGRTGNRRDGPRERLFEQSPWRLEGESGLFCYECHEELIHNPIILPDDLVRLAELVRSRGLDEEEKSPSRERLAGRVSLFHEVIALRLAQMLDNERSLHPASNQESTEGRA